MNSDFVIDDEFEPSQADSGARQLREIERQLRISHVHRDFHRNLGHLAQFGVRHLERQGAVVDVAGIALGAGDRDVFPWLEPLGRVPAADHGGNAQLACDDRGVAGAPAAICDDGRGQLHDGLPVGIRHVGHQHIALLDK